MAYHPRLIDMLIASPHRLTAAGEIDLTAAEAEMLRACGFAQLQARPLGTSRKKA